jgi:hypothetical protein
VRKDKEGNKLFKKVTIKVVFPDNIFPPKMHVQRAGPQQGFGPEGINDMLMSIADDLDTKFPWWSFRSVELAPVGSTARYVIAYAGPNPNYVAPTPEVNNAATSV